MPLDERDAAYLWDMAEICEEIEDMLGNCDEAAFLGNRLLQRAIERDVELVGEIARKLSHSFRAAHPEIAWREIVGFRNILAHEYGRVDHQLLYRTVTEDIPSLALRLRHILFSDNK